MFEQLEQVERRLEEVTHRLCDPGVAGNPEDYRRLLQESSRLTPLVDTYRQYKKAEQGIREAKALLDESGLDEELRQLAEQELSESRERREALAEELKIRLLPRDPNDERGVIMEIRAGAGGEESALFAGSLYRMYTMYAAAKGYRTEVVGVNETELGRLQGDQLPCFGRRRVQPPEIRKRRPPGAAGTRDRGRGADPHLYRHRRRASRGGGGGGGHRSKGPADRHVPVQRSRRPAYQQDRIGYPDHPPAHRHGGGMPGRTQPVQKPGQSHAGPPGPGCSKASGRSSAPLSRPTAARRSGPATAASGSVPITFPRAG